MNFRHGWIEEWKHEIHIQESAEKFSAMKMEIGKTIESLEELKTLVK